MNKETIVQTKRILVWDLPTRVFHWSLALSFLGAFVTAESERLIDLHQAFGYTMLGLIVFRLLWGVVGTRYARFGEFAFGPGKVARYLASLVRGAPQRFVGHNPAGSWAIYAILALSVLAGATGWATLNDIGGHMLEELHEGIANMLLGLVFIHIGGVLVSSLLHRENLVRAMITGMKSGNPSEAIRSARPLLGLVLAAGIVAYWTGIIG